jgi:drug/metabolite transporter (DMT)-like permease
LKPSRATALTALVAMCLVWGYSWVVMKIALRHAAPFDFASLRVGIAAIVLFAIALATGRRIALASYRRTIVVGVIQVGVFVSLSHLALVAAGPGKTSVLVFTMPFWMIVFARLLLHERMRGAQWLAVALAFSGLTLIIAPWQLGSLGGSLLAVAGGAAWALSSVISKRWPTPGTDPLVLTAWHLLFGFVPLMLFSLAFSDRPVQWNSEFVVALLFSAIFATAIGWWLWTFVLSHTKAGIAGLNALAIPCIAVIASWLQLGERPPPVELTGMSMIGIALALLGWLGLRPEGNPAD